MRTAPESKKYNEFEVVLKAGKRSFDVKNPPEFASKVLTERGSVMITEQDALRNNGRTAHGRWRLWYELDKPKVKQQFKHTQ